MHANRGSSFRLAHVVSIHPSPPPSPALRCIRCAEFIASLNPLGASPVNLRLPAELVLEGVTRGTLARYLRSPTVANLGGSAGTLHKVTSKIVTAAQALLASDGVLPGADDAAGGGDGGGDEPPAEGVLEAHGGAGGVAHAGAGEDEADAADGGGVIPTELGSLITAQGDNMLVTVLDAPSVFAAALVDAPGLLALADRSCAAALHVQSVQHFLEMGLDSWRTGKQLAELAMRRAVHSAHIDTVVLVDAGMVPVHIIAYLDLFFRAVRRLGEVRRRALVFPLARPPPPLPSWSALSCVTLPPLTDPLDVDAGTL